jgi:hypothetical protein
MKYSIFCFILLATACNSPKNYPALEGVYTALYEHEFGRNTDTLILKKANDGNGVYQITRHTGLIKKLDGKEFPKEVIIKNWVLDYNADKQILTEQKEGKILVWDSNRLTLQLGDRSYKKLSDLK